jgi:hypothetical protein
VFGSVFVCVCVFSVGSSCWMCLAGCLYPFFLDIAGSSDPATENQNQKLNPPFIRMNAIICMNEWGVWSGFTRQPLIQPKGCEAGQVPLLESL